jgi:hypothetical protein
VDIDNGIIRANFSGVIEHRVIQDTFITELGLFSTPTNFPVQDPTLLARVITVNAEFPTGIQIPAGESLVVDWAIVFQNRRF